MWCVSSPQWLCTDLRYVVLLLLYIANVNVKSVAGRLGRQYKKILISIYQWRSMSKLLNNPGKKGLIRNVQTDFLTMRCHCNWEYWKTQSTGLWGISGCIFLVVDASTKQRSCASRFKTVISGRQSSMSWRQWWEENHLTSAYHRDFCTFQCVSLFWPFRGGMLIHVDCMSAKIHPFPRSYKYIMRLSIRKNRPPEQGSFLSAQITPICMKAIQIFPRWCGNIAITCGLQHNK